MELFEKIDDILEQENHILPKKATKVKSEFSFDELMFNKMANFIINLDPNDLNDDQIQEVINMIEKLEIEIVQEERLARKTLQPKNQYSKKWYRANKTEIKRRKEKFARSSEGRKRSRREGKLAKIGKTATGRRQVKYNTRQKDRGR